MVGNIGVETSYRLGLPMLWSSFLLISVKVPTDGIKTRTRNIKELLVKMWADIREPTKEGEHQEGTITILRPEGAKG